jgi:hypothetical protein
MLPTRTLGDDAGMSLLALCLLWRVNSCKVATRVGTSNRSDHQSRLVQNKINPALQFSLAGESYFKPLIANRTAQLSHACALPQISGIRANF